MPFDLFDWADAAPPVADPVSVEAVQAPIDANRADRGRRNDCAGRAAEMAVERSYLSRGSQAVALRWRGKSGEIDLITREGDTFVITEVKKARSFDAALGRISAAQVRRICAAASEFLSGLPKGELTDVRLDAALVDGFGRVRIIENAFSAG